MYILVFNCGSSSLTFKIFELDTISNIKEILSGKAHRVGVTGSEPSFIEYRTRGIVQKYTVPIKTHQDAAGLVLKYVKDNSIKINHIGHRFVHGGSYFKQSSFITDAIFKKLRLCLPLAPIHNPVSLSVILECKKTLPGISQYVTFDSAFHSTIPVYAYTYPLPKKIIDKYNFRKYGFHGLSYSYVSNMASLYLNSDPEKSKIVACHLGTGGASIAAIKGVHSVDTSMGYSPLPGLIMSTRCGDIDSMLAIYLMALYDYRPDDLLELLNKKCGLLGISGFSSDIRDIINCGSQNGKENAKLAFSMYIHRLRKYIGSYIAVLGGIDILVFTDDIGIKNSLVREKVCEGMDWCGILLDIKLNRRVVDNKIHLVSSDKSKVKILTIPPEEELVIALEGAKLIKGGKQ